MHYCVSKHYLWLFGFVHLGRGWSPRSYWTQVAMVRGAEHPKLSPEVWGPTSAHAPSHPGNSDLSSAGEHWPSSWSGSDTSPWCFVSVCMCEKLSDQDMFLSLCLCDREGEVMVKEGSWVKHWACEHSLVCSSSCSKSLGGALAIYSSTNNRSVVSNTGHNTSSLPYNVCVRENEMNSFKIYQHF